MSTEGGSVTLVPGWFKVASLAVLLVGMASGVAIWASASGPFRLSGPGLVVATGGALVAAWSALLRPRRHREPAVTADGTRCLRAPLATVGGLLVAWGALMVLAVVLGWTAVVDFDALEAPGAVFLVVVGAVGLLPDLVRLLTGRLHRWTLEVGPETVRYRGYRTDRTWPRREVRGGTIQRRGPAGVRIDVKGGDGPVVPITAFDVPAEQIVELLRRR